VKKIIRSFSLGKSLSIGNLFVEFAGEFNKIHMF